MKFIRSVTEVFGYSPFKALHKHAELCGKAVIKLKEQFEACRNRDFEKVKELEEEIDGMEYQADLLKQEIRTHVTKSLMLPVDRQDLLNFLKPQDSIIDYCEHAAHMIVYRELKISEEIWDDLIELLEKVNKTVMKYEELVDHVARLIAASFTKKEVQDAMNLVPEIEHFEHECDKVQIRLHKKILNAENTNPLDVILLRDIVIQIGEIANNTARAANAFRTMVLSR